jgi:transcriptional regulator with XRE-family HTH domain
VTIATRVRDCRYSKGWGPDELASRAEISRTALYQIECGKTETPRASTLRRIAQALDVTIESLLGRDEMDDRSLPLGTSSTPGRTSNGWSDSDPMVCSEFGSFETVPSSSLAAAGRLRSGSRPVAPRFHSRREEELIDKFQELLASPLGDGLARLIEESHRMIPQVARHQLG